MKMLPCTITIGHHCNTTYKCPRSFHYSDLCWPWQWNHGPHLLDRRDKLTLQELWSGQGRRPVCEGKWPNNIITKNKKLSANLDVCCKWHLSMRKRHSWCCYLQQKSLPGLHSKMQLYDIWWQRGHHCGSMPIQVWILKWQIKPNTSKYLSSTA